MRAKNNGVVGVVWCGVVWCGVEAATPAALLQSGATAHVGSGAIRAIGLRSLRRDARSDEHCRALIEFGVMSIVDYCYYYYYFHASRSTTTTTTTTTTITSVCIVHTMGARPSRVCVITHISLSIYTHMYREREREGECIRMENTTIRMVCWFSSFQPQVFVFLDQPWLHTA